MEQERFNLDENLAESVARVIGENPGASMAEIARAAGVSRTTLHRAYGDRQSMVEIVAAKVLADCSELFDRAGIDSAAPEEAFVALTDSVVTLGLAYTVLFGEPQVYRTPGLVKQIEAQDDRLERFFARGQESGYFRADVSPRWLWITVGSLAVGVGYAIQEGHVGAREAPRLTRETLGAGILTR